LCNRSASYVKAKVKAGGSSISADTYLKPDPVNAGYVVTASSATDPSAFGRAVAATGAIGGSDVEFQVAVGFE
jgi:hypothetical protein